MYNIFSEIKLIIVDKIYLMNFKNILFFLLSFTPFICFAQVQKINKPSEILVKEFRIDAKNMNELKNFNWEMIPEMFKTNQKDDNITLSVFYSNKNEVSNSKTKVTSFNYKVSGKTENLSSLISKSKDAVLNFTSTAKE